METCKHCGWQRIAPSKSVERRLEAQRAPSEREARFEKALREIVELLGWHCDDEANIDELSPPDMVAHVNGLARNIAKEALSPSPNPEGK